ncbi:MAG: hypothetical protein SGILL_005378 [Bacillariaceae sp.]
MLAMHSKMLAFLALAFLSAPTRLCDASSASSSLVVRLRLADGSIEKIQITDGKEETFTLDDILEPFNIPDDSKIKVGASTIEDGTASNLKDLGIKHGTMITIIPKISPKKPTESRFAKLKDAQKKKWDPYPDLAKDYEHALLKTKTRRSSNSGMSYGDIAGLQSSLHLVEPQPEGPLKRIYMCRISAERFHANGVVNKKGKSKPEISCRVGLLLGTLQKERVDLKPRKARTSLSSQTSDSEYCQVAKVQALWEPPGQSPSKDGKLYDANKGQELLTAYPRVLAIAEQLGLVPVGWIYSYQDDRLEEKRGSDEEPQALLGMDVATGAALQIQNMKKRGRFEGNRFVTLAMDAPIGATEAFQLSDVTIQMVHEEMFDSLVPPSKALSQKSNPRTIPTRHEVLVDGRETTKLESVLCLINTAMLSNVGNYAGKSSASSVKKSNGSLTNKAKKTLLKALEAGNRAMMEELCDFTVLMALDQSLSESEMEHMCGCVKKWARGQKEGTALDSKLKLKLKSILGS